jgi:hypothetical protein
MIGAGIATLWIHKGWSIYGGLILATIGMIVQGISGFTFKVDQAALKAYDVASQAFANKTISEVEYKAARAAWDGVIQDNKGIFTLGLLLMGLGLGASVPGLIGSMMDLTDKANAALYIGIWGIAQAFGQGLSNLGAGAMRDAAFNAFPNDLGTGYGFVFTIQALGMCLALYLYTRVNVKEFQQEILANAPALRVITEEAAIPAPAPGTPGAVAWFSADTATGGSTALREEQVIRKDRIK